MLVEYKPGTTFPGVIGRTVGESSLAWPAPLRANEGAPNVLFIVLDDTGFGQLGCYGSPIDTPNINRLAENGRRYTNTHAPGKIKNGDTGDVAIDHYRRYKVDQRLRRPLRARARGLQDAEANAGNERRMVPRGRKIERGRITETSFTKESAGEAVSDSCSRTRSGFIDRLRPWPK
jgi:hypothetical protein